jgi:NAD(P)-dependent dehydrogenase (short-subunit alcohol dehydrogenase family)
MLKDTSLVGKRVLITAGASGIGLVTARGFIEAGARVFICDVNAEALTQAQAALPGLQGCLADVADEAQVLALFARVDAALGGLDVLINNAGIAGPTARIADLKREDILRTLEVNVIGQFLCAKHAVGRLRQGRGPCILNMSSAAGHLGFPARSAYSASKWAVIGLTKSLAIELGPDRIRVNAVLPGAVDGPRIRAVIAAKAEVADKSVAEVTQAYEGQAALGRMVTAEDIANTILFACSDLAANVNGQSLAVDGLTQALS